MNIDGLSHHERHQQQDEDGQSGHSAIHNYPFFFAVVVVTLVVGGVAAEHVHPSIGVGKVPNDLLEHIGFDALQAGHDVARLEFDLSPDGVGGIARMCLANPFGRWSQLASEIGRFGE